jgi:transaldolase
MKFFVDTADVAEIKDLAASGLLDGVTTNPSLIMKAGRPMLDVIQEICAIFKHALTDNGLKAFLDDWAKTGQSIL